MARTKKQTLENASERKRQIQEEIRRGSLTQKQKKDAEAHAQCPSPMKGDFEGAKGKISTLNQIGLHSAAFLRGMESSYSTEQRVVPSLPLRIGRKRLAAATCSGRVDILPSSMSSCSKGQSDDLPKAVLCIPDIFKSSPMSQEEGYRESADTKAFMATSDKDVKHFPSSGNTGKKRLFKQTYSASMSSDKQGKARNSETLKESVNVSLRALKAASELMRMEKGKKRQASQSPDKSVIKSSGRRSPRQHSPGSSSEKQIDSMRTEFVEERPKINIFTDNLGVELGKRIRSPRRLSEDMIALPIFSARRWNHSSKESPPGHPNSRSPSESGASPKSTPGHDSSFKSPSPSSRKSISANTSLKAKSSKPTNKHKNPKKELENIIGDASSKVSQLSEAVRGEDKNVKDNKVQIVGVEPEEEAERRRSKAYPLRKSRLGPVISDFQEKSSKVEKSSENKGISLTNPTHIGQSGSALFQNSDKSTIHPRQDKVKPKKKKQKAKKIKHKEIEEICKEIIKEVVISKQECDESGKDKSILDQKTELKPTGTSNFILGESNAESSEKTLTKTITTDSGAKLEQTEFVAKLDVTEFITRLEQTESFARLDQSEFAIKLEQTESAANLKQTEFSAKLEQTESAAKLKHSESIAKPKLEQTQFEAELKQAESVVKPDQGESTARLEQAVLAARPKEAESTSKLKQTESTARPEQVESAVKLKQTESTAKQEQAESAVKLKQTESTAKQEQAESAVKLKQTEPTAKQEQAESAVKLKQTESTAKQEQAESTPRPEQAESTSRLEEAIPCEQTFFSESGPSLLEAMLVGGKEVAKSYCQEKEKQKPQSVESSPIIPPSCFQVSVKCEQSSLHLSEGVRTTEKLSEDSLQCHEIMCNEDPLYDLPSELQETKIDKINAIQYASSNEMDSKSSVGCNNSFKHSKKQKDFKIDFASQLKALDESVFKLMDIDQEKDVIETKWETVVPEDLSSTGNLAATKLYRVIQELVKKLKSSDSLCSFPPDVEAIDKLVKSCPHNAHSIIPKVDESSRLDHLQKRLKEEEARDKEKGSAGDQTSVKPLNYKEENPLSSGNNKGDLNEKEILETPQTHSTDTNLPKINASSSAVSKNLRQKPPGKETKASPLKFISSKPSIECSKPLSCPSINDDKSPVSQSSSMACFNDPFSSSSTKKVFQKSKTMDNTGESDGTKVSILRRVNSSPQIDVEPSLLIYPSTSVGSPGPCASYRSKLGKQIPIPSTSYSLSASRKSWRTPRIIKETKPLSVLSNLEKNHDLSTADIFVCPSLQKYLTVPSHRVIVPSCKKEEMEKLDAEAKEEMKRKEKEEELKEKIGSQADEEMDELYKKYEPDFDEVDGMLFMSFTSEVELKAHVRVEKALQWDKDDTMLRISRAKAFENAKIHNENMANFKLKQLRGQHMRWKKYRRMYSNEVRILLEAQKNGISYDQVELPKKTSDVTKIKGWKKRQSHGDSSMDQDSKENLDLNFGAASAMDYSFHSSCSIDGKPQFKMPSIIPYTSGNDESLSGDLETPERKERCSAQYAKRKKMFSHLKSHRQLFKELHMDWEDRMIHKKLGGWSLKGNRPKAFSQAAQKRAAKKSGEFIATSDGSMDQSPCTSAGEFDSTDSFSLEHGENSHGNKKRRMCKLVYPLLSERMAKNALKNLFVGNLSEMMNRKKKRKSSRGSLPSLTPIPGALSSCTPDDSQPCILNVCSTKATAGSPATPKSSLLSPTLSPTTTQLSATGKERLLSGVDTPTTDQKTNSPSISEAPSTISSKSCGKPGCRYGCICHLCSLPPEEENPEQSPSPENMAPPPLVCEKEYCRLGCICDSIDPEKTITAEPNHCGKPTCMLQCICSAETSGLDEGYDIPYLPSMKRRPKGGERFSNLPQRERTHRSAKNLDAVTRKALMLYETSEIFCEKVERTSRKKSTDPSNSQSNPLVVHHFHTPVEELSTPEVYTEIDSPYKDSFLPTVKQQNPSTSTVLHPVNVTEKHEKTSNIMFNAVNLLTAQETSVAASNVVSPSGAPATHMIKPEKLERLLREEYPMNVLDEERHTVPIMEPNAHKRKRKSHPLSDEIFSYSTCARTQPFHVHKALIEKIRKHAPIDISSGSNSPVTHTPQAIAGRRLSEPKQELGHSSKHVEQRRYSQSSENRNLASSSHLPNPHISTTAPSTGPVPPVSSLMSHLPVQHIPRRLGADGKPVRHHGWHTSMVCLKSRARPKSLLPDAAEEEDVQEEDEVKLLEFAANCNWDGAKKEILGKVAQCLIRGQYPQPRTMNVSEFVVEILPKAHQPSVIPDELRAKLPGQMFSIRVRITRRDSSDQMAKKAPEVIDLSESPIKPPLTTHAPTSTMLQDDPRTASTFSNLGISGLNQMLINSMGRQPSGGPSESSSSVSSDTISSAEKKQATLTDTLSTETARDKSTNGMTEQIKLSGQSFKHVKSSTSNVSVSAGAAPFTGGNRFMYIPSSNTSLTPVIQPLNGKDIKYMKIGSANDRMVQVLGLGTVPDKGKKLIAVPFPLPAASGDNGVKASTLPPFVAVPISGSGQTRVVPLLSSGANSSSGQQIMLKLPLSQRAPPTSLLVQQQLVAAGKSRKTIATDKLQRVSLAPAVSSSLLSIPKPFVSQSLVNSPILTPITTVCSNFTEAIKTSNTTEAEEASIVMENFLEKNGAMKESVIIEDGNTQADGDYGGNSTTTVTASRDKPIMSAEISSLKLKSQTEVMKETDKDKSGATFIASEITSKGALESGSFEANKTNLAIEDRHEEMSVPNPIELADKSCSVSNSKLSSNYKSDPSLINKSQNDSGEESSAQSAEKGSVLFREVSTAAGSQSRLLSGVDYSDSPTRSVSKFTESCGSSVGHSTLKDPGSEEGMSNSRKRSAFMEDSEEPLPEVKRVYLPSERWPVLDEESNASMELSQACSPYSAQERPKSVMSSALSSGSSDDVMIMLSSDEEIDVGEETLEHLSAQLVHVERAMIMDHGSLFSHNSKPPIPFRMNSRTKRPYKFSMDKTKARCNLLDNIRSDTQIIRLQQLQCHNARERERRSRLKQLFEFLQAQIDVTTGQGNEQQQMSKASVLTTAKNIILDLRRLDFEQAAELAELNKRKEELTSFLKDLKGEKSQLEVEVLEVESSLKTTQKGETSQHVGELLVDLVSEDDEEVEAQEQSTNVAALPKVSQPARPVASTERSDVYEDISEAEDTSAAAALVGYEDISEPEEAQQKYDYEDISEPEDVGKI